MACKYKCRFKTIKEFNRWEFQEDSRLPFSFHSILPPGIPQCPPKHKLPPTHVPYLHLTSMLWFPTAMEFSRASQIQHVQNLTLALNTWSFLSLPYPRRWHPATHTRNLRIIHDLSFSYMSTPVNPCSSHYGFYPLNVSICPLLAISCHLAS